MKEEDDISGIREGGATRIGLPHHYRFDNTDARNMKKSRWGPRLKSKCKNGAGTKNAAKKAAKKAAKQAVKKEKQKKFHCDICDKDLYCLQETDMQRHIRSKKHQNRLIRSKKRQKRLQNQNQDVGKQYSDTNNEAISPSLASDQQLIRDDSSYAQSDTDNWNEMYNEQFYDNNRHTRIAEANREWRRANSQVEELQSQSIAPNMIGLQPDDCPSNNQAFQSSSANSASQTHGNSDQYAHARSIAEPEQNYDELNTDVGKSNKNLMKLTAKQSLQTSYPQGCRVIYSHEKDSNDSDDTRIRIGTVHAVYIDMSFSRQLIYEIKTKSEMIFVEEHALAFAPQCPILFHKTPCVASASVKDDEKALEGIVLASQWSIVKLSYTILLQHSTADEYTIRSSVSGENISYRPPNSRP